MGLQDLLAPCLWEQGIPRGKLGFQFYLAVRHICPLYHSPIFYTQIWTPWCWKTGLGRKQLTTPHNHSKPDSRPKTQGIRFPQQEGDLHTSTPGASAQEVMGSQVCLSRHGRRPLWEGGRVQRGTRGSTVSLETQSGQINTFPVWSSTAWGHTSRINLGSGKSHVSRDQRTGTMLLYSPWPLSSASGKEHNEDTQYSGGGINRRQAHR